MEDISKVIRLVKEAQTIAARHGYTNLMQPGLIKELAIAEILGHKVIAAKREADAYDRENPDRKFEYLSCFEDGTFQIDRMFKRPEEKRRKSLQRIARNAAVYCVVFRRNAPLDVKVIYEVPTDAMVREAERQLDISRNDISHVGFTQAWCEEHGRVVYSNRDT